MSESTRREDVPPAMAKPRRPEDFDALYTGTPPWDIGRPQPVFLALARARRLRGRVLDVGCGTGEHALMAAALGLDATGLDAAPAAIRSAERKAAERGLTARFLVWNALEMATLDQQFDTVLDCGLFHIFEDDDRARFVESLRTVMRPGSRYQLLCFSDSLPGGFGPRRVSQDEIRASFRDGWQIDSIEVATIETTMGPLGVPAWHATITRTAEESRRI